MAEKTAELMRSSWSCKDGALRDIISVAGDNKNNETYSKSNINVEEFPYYSNVNKNKECFFSFKSGMSNPDLYSFKDEWKHKDNNHLCEVNSAVRLFCESPKISMSYEIQTKKPTQLGAVKGMMDQVSSVLDTVASLDNFSKKDSATNGISSTGIRQSGIGKVAEYTDSDVFTGVSPLKIDSTLKFEFRFGQFGLFNALEEVVKPIAVLSSVFAPQTELDKDGNPTSKAYVPYPTESQWTAAVLKNAFSLFTGDNKKYTISSSDTKTVGTGDDSHEETIEAKFNLSKEEGDHTSALTTAINLQNSLFDKIHSTIQEVLSESGWEEYKYKYAYFQWGKFVLGPCTIKSVKVEFDSTMIDSNGWPYSGSISLGGITSYANATSNRIKQFYGV